MDKSYMYVCINHKHAPHAMKSMFSSITLVSPMGPNISATNEYIVQQYCWLRE